MGLPDSAKSPSTPIAFRKNCVATSVATATATALPEKSEAFLATCSTAHTNTAKSATTVSVPTSPSSSPTMAKMKSLCASGR